MKETDKGQLSDSKSFGFNKSGLALGNKRFKMKISSPHESLSVVLYRVVVFNQSAGAIGNASTDTDLSKISNLLLVSKR